MNTNEKDIPIDIHVNKLLDWLVSRRHCNRDWQKHVLVIRKKINTAIQDMPAVDEITQLLSGTYINYFHCCYIVEVLKQTEASSKNIFGQYSSQRMKDWQEIVKLYEKDNLYLAEAAQMLVRNVNYEIPSLKKHISKCAQLYEDYIKKEANYHKSGNDLKVKYFASCKQMGLEGKNVKMELLLLSDEMPEILRNVSENTKALKPAYIYYLAFLNFTLARDCSEKCLPLISYIIEKGNTSTYEWKTGEAPDLIEIVRPDFPLDVDNGSTVDDQIDFGEFTVLSESDRSSSSPNGEFVHIEKEDCKVDGIDFGDSETDGHCDITVEKSGNSQFLNSSSQQGTKFACGEEALSVLENPETRTFFYNELLELQGFLEQRLLEIKSEEDVLSSSMLQFAPSDVQLVSDNAVLNMIHNVKEVSSLLMSTKMKHLYLIKESTKYVDRLVDNLKSKLELSDKMFILEKLMAEKSIEVSNEQKMSEPKVNLIIKRTKELQEQIEKDISKRYKNRSVNIMGVSHV